MKYSITVGLPEEKFNWCPSSHFSIPSGRIKTRAHCERISKIISRKPSEGKFDYYTPKRFDIFSPITGGCSEGLGVV